MLQPLPELQAVVAMYTAEVEEALLALLAHSDERPTSACLDRHEYAV